MINFNKVNLIKQCMQEYYSAYSLTTDTLDYVPEKVNLSIIKKIYKCQCKSFKAIDREDRKFQKVYKAYLSLCATDEESRLYKSKLKRFNRLNRLGYINLEDDSECKENLEEEK